MNVIQRISLDIFQQNLYRAGDVTTQIQASSDHEGRDILRIEIMNTDTDQGIEIALHEDETWSYGAVGG